MDQGYADLLAAIARQAVTDYRNGAPSTKHMDARAWLEAAGLLETAQRNPAARHTPSAFRCSW
jgi:hypothetical protein